MFARVHCPSCQYKFTIPEGDMGKRHVCPNCQSPFFAGKSVADGPPVAMKQQSAPEGSYAKTMLGETAPAPSAIKFNCPRCKAPQEAAAAEAGTKKPCSACGQRLQVPAPPAPPAPTAAAPNLNKTMLVGDDSSAAPPIKYNCPACKKPLEAPAGEALVKKPCPACGQRHQVPAAPAGGSPNDNNTMLVTDGGTSSAAPGFSASGSSPTAPASGAAPTASGSSFLAKALTVTGCVVVVLVLLAFLLPAKQREDTTAMVEMKKELERLRADIETKKQEFENQKKYEAKLQQQREEDARAFRLKQEELELKRSEAMKNEAYLNDKKAKAEADAKFAEDQRRFEQEKKEAEDRRKRDADATKAQLDLLAAQLKEANNRQTTIIQQPPPPVMYYPPYHPRYYWPW